jgi:hypothetical protein
MGTDRNGTDLNVKPLTTEHRSRNFIFAVLVLGAVVAMVLIATSTKPAKALPPEVRAYFDTARQQCREAGDRLHVEDETSFTETAEFNGDDHPDYVVHKDSLYCPSFGRSEFCGSAGCEVVILVSEGDRLNVVADNNYQRFVITQPVDGKQSIAIAAHGTFCGHESGADTCFGTISWTPEGFRTTYTETAPAALKIATETPPNDNGRPDKNPQYDWKLIRPAAGKQEPLIAMSDGTPERAKTVITCADNIPVMIVSFPPAANAPPPDAQVMFEIGDPGLNQSHAEMILQQTQDNTAYIGQLSSAALTIMQTTAGQNYAVVPTAWTLANRDYWIDTPPLPLTHFNETAQAVLDACGAPLR